MANSGKGEGNEKSTGSETKGRLEDDLEDDIDALFALPWVEFTGARNALAARLKRSGRSEDADRVKALVKPPISAWAVNQLYWKHRKEFDPLIAAGQRYLQAQASQLAGKASDMRGPLDARRKVLSDLSHLAAALLRDAAHNPTPDLMRRIGATLEAVSASGSHPDTPRPGRLTEDLDPPGFESLASLIPDAGMANRKERVEAVNPARKPVAVTNSRKEATLTGIHEREEIGQARIAVVKLSLQNAERALAAARAKAEGAAVALKKASADAKEAEEHRRDAAERKRQAEERLEKATAASKEAGKHASSLAAAEEAAAKEVREAERTLENAARKLQSLLPKLRARK